MNKTEFLTHMLNKTAISLPAINLLLTQSFEMETASKNEPSVVKANLQRLGKGVASDKTVNDGNGWNDDSHEDGTVRYNDRNVQEKGYHDCETSSSPLHGTTYQHMRAEIGKMLEIYKQATGGQIHSIYASNHVHNTLAYTFASDAYGETVAVSNLNAKMVYRYLGLFIVKYYPTLKWLCMTAPKGARGASGNRYDRLNNDKIFQWFRDYRLWERSHSQDSDNFLKGMARESILRIYDRQKALHWENRMCDNTASATHLSSWMALNRALTIWAIDFGRNGHKFDVTYDDFRQSYKEVERHRLGYQYVDMRYIETQWQEIKSYLAKYFKIAGCLDAIKELDKLIDRSIPEYLKKAKHGIGYNPYYIERAFAKRNRDKDEELHQRYMDCIQSMIVPHAAKLDEFHQGVADCLGITFTNAKSLYQMFKRQNIEIEWLGNRLVYMGD